MRLIPVRFKDIKPGDRVVASWTLDDVTMFADFTVDKVDVWTVRSRSGRSYPNAPSHVYFLNPEGDEK